MATIYGSDVNPYAYEAQSEDPLLDDIFCLRRTTLKRKLEFLKVEIAKRGQNLEENLQSIEKDLCGCETISANLPYGAEEIRTDIILRHKFPLYRERRQQETDCLRDTAMLRKELLDTTLQYLSLRDKEALVQ